MLKTLNKLMNRGSTGLRPPPGYKGGRVGEGGGDRGHL